MGNGSRSHHLLKHALPEVDVKEHFGSIEPKEITREINRLGQRDLQAKFRAVYGTQTFSNNNNWLRRKLLEAAGLQTPKAIARGRPAAKQARTLSQGDALCDDSPTVSGSDSFGSHDDSHRAPSPVASVIRRTKRARKPKQFDDMLFMNQGHGQAVSDDEENGHQLKIPTSSSRFNRSELVHDSPLLPCNSGTLADDLMWCPTAGSSYRPGHIVALAPTTPTPELLLSRPQLPLYNGPLASLLGPAEVLGYGPASADEGDLSLPQWARLPSNDRTASCDLDDASAQDSRSSGSPACSGFDASPYDHVGMEIAPGTPPYDHLEMAPGTPPQLVASASVASVSPVLHDSPFAAAFGHGLVITAARANQLMPFAGPADFDCFARPPPQAATALPQAATGGADKNVADVFDEKVVSAFGVSDSCDSEMSVLDIFLEELSSQQELTHDLSQLAPLESMWDIDAVV